jgi:hypothetical protein
MRRLFLAAALLLAGPLQAQAVPADTLAPDSVRAPVDSVWVVDEERVDAYLGDLVSVESVVWITTLGLLDHVRTEPDEWGGGADALAARILSRSGGHVVRASVRHGLAAALGRTTEYRRCGCDGPERRIAYAITETFTDYDEQGRRRLSTPFLAGTYAGALAPVLWHPDADAAEALQSGTISLVWAIANSIVNELWASP